VHYNIDVVDLSKAEKLHDMVYVFHNFFSDEQCELTMQKSKMGKEHESYKIPKVKTFVKLLKDGVSMEQEKEILNASLKPGPDVLYSDLCITNVQKGAAWGPHEDSMKGRDFNKEGRLFYAGVLYLNDFEGGEIVYPDIKIKYKGKKGDLIIHDCNIWHFVNTVKTEDRYAMTFYIWKKHDDIYEMFLQENGTQEEWDWEALDD
jgi:predicted 2-oxoglutarate/Fe(II)-dependent dioxygenase YbiX